ncbi:PIN domain-containing protein [Candidatus Woesearchaeota archaeon]|nr:PIN domain-containing protein [Candidatus Woesearchaeota archaeon]
MLLDSSAWIDFIEGNEKGRKIRQIIEGQDSFTSLATIAELTQWCLKNRREEVATIEDVKRISQILPLTETISRVAGRMNYERKKAGKKWGMMDSIIASTAQVYGLKILTTDNGFRDLQEAQVL